MSVFTISAIVAMGRNRVIGDGEKMPWHLPGDLKRLKSITMGKPLIMGRRTFLSIGRPLPGRANIVMTRDPGFSAEGIILAKDFDHALALAGIWAGENGADEIIIFGGGQIYELAMPVVQRLYLTEVDLSPEGGTMFPEIDESQWTETLNEPHPASDAAPGFTYRTLERT